MEDFLRLNLMSVIGVFFAIVLAIAIYVIMMKNMKDKELRKYFTIAFFLVFAVILFFGIQAIINQVAVNNIPRSTIDRSYLQQHQKALDADVHSHSSDYSKG